MTDLLDRAVHDVLEDFFAAAPEHTALSATRNNNALAPRRRLPGVLVVASGLTAAAGIAGVIVIASRDHDSSGTSPVTPVTVDNTVDSDGITTDYSNPGYRVTALPPELTVTAGRAAYTANDVPVRPDSGTTWIVLGHRDDDTGDISDKIDVSVDYGRIFAPPPDAGYTHEPVTVAGVPGEIVRSTNDAQVVVEYQWGEQVVTVRADAGDDSQIVDDMIDLANLVRLDEASATLEEPLPAGYDILTSGPWQAEADNHEPATITSSDSRNVDSITVSFETNPPDDYQYWFMGDDLTETTIRGHQAFITSVHDMEPGDVPAVMWLERPDLMIKVTGDGVTLDAVIAAAQSLEPMTDNEWRDLLANPVTDGSATTTTIVAELSTTRPRCPGGDLQGTYTLGVEDNSRSAVAERLDVTLQQLDDANANTTDYDTFHPGLEILVPCDTSTT